jgi:adenosine deaminase
LDWFDLLPKTEIHLHLEGAIPLPALWRLVQKYGGDPAVPDLQALEQKFQFRDFPHFIDTWVWKSRFIRDYEDFSAIAEAVARELAAQNIRYAEVFYSPGDFVRQKLTLPGITEAIRRGLSRVPQVEVALICDLIRDHGPERGLERVAQLAELKALGVIGIGIGGSEQAFPPGPFARVYEEARKRGFRTTAHAGEAAGAESVWSVLKDLRVERIGHGVRAVEDEALLDHLAEARIPLEVCPSSNLCLKVVKSLKEHPIRRFLERGILVTVNTDDPAMFGCTLTGEYLLLEKELGFSREAIRALVLAGVEATWLPPERKKALSAAFVSDPAWAV